MGESHDLMNLDWVQADIEQSLQQAQQALEAYLEDAVSMHLQTSYEAVHQVHGSLLMAGVPGAIMLAEQISNLLKAMLAEQVEDLDGACSALAQALVYMPSYLNRVKSDAEDAPALLRTVMNDIREVLGEAPIEEIALFNPALGASRERASAEDKARFDKVSQAELRKFRQVYQFALIGLIRKEDMKVNTARLSNVLARLQQICQNTPINQLWEVASSFIESLLLEGTELNAGTLDLLRSLEREIKEFIHAGVFALDRQAHPAVMKGMLYWVAKSSQTGPHIQSIRQAYDLERYELSDVYGKKTNRLAGPDPETFKMVATALGEELERVKDSVDLYMRSSDKTTADVSGMLPSLRQIASTLVMLNFEAPRLVIQEQIDSLTEKFDSGIDITDAQLLQVAEALLFVEAELDTLSGFAQAVDQGIPSALVGAAAEVVISESLSSLRKAKDMMHAFLGDDQNFNLLEAVPNTLRSVYGGLAMLSQSTTAQLVMSVSQYVEDDIIAQQIMPDEEAIEALAEVMASVEFCLEGMAARQPVNKAVLDRAKAQIAKLGYPVEQTDGISSDEMDYEEPASQFEVDTNSFEEHVWSSEAEGQESVVPLDADSNSDDLAQPALHERDWVVPDYVASDASEGAATTEADVAVIASNDNELDNAPPPLHERDWVVPEYVNAEDVGETAELNSEPALGLSEESETDEQPLHERDWVTPAYAVTETADELFEEDVDSTTLTTAELPDNDWIVPDEAELIVEQPDDEDDLIDEEILEIFTEEALEVFEEIDRHWPVYVADNSNHEALTESRRAFHTLKGSGRMVKAEVIAELSWSIENLLNRLIEGELLASQGISNLVNEIRPALPVLLSHFQAQTAPDIDIQPWVKRADQLASGDDEVDIEAQPSAPQDITEDTQAVDYSAVEVEELPEQLDDPASVFEMAESVETDRLLDEAFETLAATDLDELPETLSLSESQLDDEASDTALYELFIKEAEQHLAKVQAFIDEVEAASEPLMISDDVYRALHTLKGSAKMALLNVFAGIAEPTEQLALVLINTEQPVDAELQQALRTAHNMMVDAVALLPENPQQELPEADEFVTQLLALCQRREALLDDETETDSIAQRFIRDNVDRICDLTDGYEEWRLQTQIDSPLLRQLQSDADQLCAAINDNELPQVQALLAALAEAFGKLVEQQVRLDDVALQTLDDANDGLIGLFDQIASSQSMSDCSEWVNRLATDLQPQVEQSSIAEEVYFESGASSEEEPDTELIEIFLEEADEILEQASIAKQHWIDNSADAEALDELQRCLHTLKGGARMAGIMGVGDLSHELESVYEDVAAGKLELNAELYNTVHACDDRIMDMLGELRSKLHCGSATDLINQVRAYRESGGQRTLVAGGDVNEAAASASADTTALLQTLTEQINNSSTAGINAEQALTEMRASLAAFQQAAYQSSLNEAGDLCHIFQEVLASVDADELLQEAAQTDLADWLERLNTSCSEAFQTQIDDEPQLEVQPVAATDDVLEARKPAQDNVRVSASLLEQLVDLAGETSVSRSRVEQQVNNYSHAIDEVDSTIERLREQLRRLENETETQILFRQEREGPNYEGFDPLEMDRYSRMQELSRALMESVSDLLDLKETLRDQVSVTENLLLQQARTNTELHEGLMKARMVPFSRLVPRLRRIVRQVSGELNKRVELSLKNPETELDRSLLEHMTAPLEHMLRNAVDHGVESPEVRTQAGKPAEGLIALSLRRDGGDIVLELRDDGAGIDIERVRNKAIERGLMTADAKLTDHEILQFILQQGFTTAEKVTQISGRGVGMDVVFSEIRQLGGSINIDSQLGQGSCFTVRLPFTVSISRALMVNVGEDTFALPLSSIEGVVRINPYELEEYFKEDGPDFEYAGVKYDLHYLGDFVGRAQSHQVQAGVLPLPVILIRANDHAIAVQVDNITGSREVVVKPLGPQFGNVPGMSGATILGDGRVVLILDMAAMIREHLAREGIKPLGDAIQAPADIRGRLRVMVVDDSVTVRKVASRLLERHGMEVVLAKDGVEAMTKLQDMVPNIMLLDIEMPRMDGFELASLMRHDENLSEVPIIMISSRTGDKHRARAREIGINQFMGKPFQEAGLLQAISELTGVEFETERA